MAFQALIGGALIGLAGAILLLFNGRILGASGITSAFITKFVQGKWNDFQERFELGWRGFFLLGIVAGGVGTLAFAGGSFAPQPSPVSTPILAIAGIFVGIGTRMGLGCTSGHGVCGISRFSLRSLLATVIFIVAGMATAYLMRTIGGI